MEELKPISLLSLIIIIVCALILWGGAWDSDSSPATPEGARGAAPAGEGSPPGDGAPPGGVATTLELGSKYSLEILAPSGIPEKTVHIKDPKGKISAAMDSEHGTQALTNVSFDGKTLKFTAVLGSDGNEKFDFTMKLYNGGILLGECEGGRGPSPVVMKAVE